MGIVIFGHGGLSPIAAKDMEWVAIPAGTTLQFYADAGQTLDTGKVTWANYAQKLEAPWPALDSTRVTYNLSLSALSAEEQKEIDVLGADFPHTIVMIGRDLPSAQLCTGDSKTCPSDPRMVAGTVPGPREHGCDGLLATYKGQELHWIACTGISRRFGAEVRGVVEAARGDAPASVVHGEDPDDPMPSAVLSDGQTKVGAARAYLESSPDAFPAWFDSLSADDQALLLKHPIIAKWSDERRIAAQNAAASGAAEGGITSEDEIDWVAMDELNASNLKDTPDEETVYFAQAGPIVLIGEGHPWPLVRYVGSQPSYASGQITLNKGGTFSSGSLDVTGCIDQANFEAAINRISKKSVQFE